MYSQQLHGKQPISNFFAPSEDKRVVPSDSEQSDENNGDDNFNREIRFTRAPRGIQCEPVFLNVYDILKINDYFSFLGVGVFHSGIQVYDIEFAYGGHQFPFSGIFEMAPRDFSDLGGSVRFRESIPLGLTELSHLQVYEIIEDLGCKFTGSSYHLLKNNCNHFTNHLAQILCGKGIPGWINRLANVSAYVPFLHRMLPVEWLTPRHILRDDLNG